MKFRINKRQFNDMKKSYYTYKASFADFEKMSEQRKKEISKKLVESESRNSVEIEHKKCLSSC